MKFPVALHLYKNEDIGCNYIRFGDFAVSLSTKPQKQTKLVSLAELEGCTLLESIDQLDHPEIHEVDCHDMQPGDIAVDRSSGRLYLVIQDEDLAFGIELETLEFVTYWYTECYVYSLEQLFE